MHGPGHDDLREIDILIETAIGDYRIRIAVEAKDEGRPMDSTKFESVVGKYLVEGGVRVNKIVVVTHHGFYQPVIERAKKLDIDLLTLSEAKELDWSRFQPPGPCFQTRPHIDNITLHRRVSTVSIDAILRGGIIVVRVAGTTELPNNLPRVFWQRVVHQHRELLLQLDDEAAGTPGGKKANVVIDASIGHEVYLLLENKHYRVDRISFDVHCQKEDEPTQPPPALIHFSFALRVAHWMSFRTSTVQVRKELRREGRVVCSCCGKDHGTLFEWAHERTMRRFLPSSPAAQKLLADGVRDSPQRTCESLREVAFLQPSTDQVSRKGVRGEGDRSRSSCSFGIRHSRMQTIRAHANRRFCQTFESVAGDRRWKAANTPMQTELSRSVFL